VPRIYSIGNECNIRFAIAHMVRVPHSSGHSRPSFPKCQIVDPRKFNSSFYMKNYSTAYWEGVNLRNTEWEQNDLLFI
jgi:hypothetical protein